MTVYSIKLEKMGMPRLTKIAEHIGIFPLCGEEMLEREVRGGYVGDLLSDVIANASESDLWITVQTHANIVAVATLKDLAGIVIVNGKVPDDATLKRAKAEKIPIFSTKLSAFEVAGKLYKILSLEAKVEAKKV